MTWRWNPQKRGKLTRTRRIRSTKSHRNEKASPFAFMNLWRDSLKTILEIPLQETIQNDLHFLDVLVALFFKRRHGNYTSSLSCAWVGSCGYECQMKGSGVWMVPTTHRGSEGLGVRLGNQCLFRWNISLPVLVQKNLLIWGECWAGRAAEFYNWKQAQTAE